MRKWMSIIALALAAGAVPAWAQTGPASAPPRIPVARFAALPSLYKPLLSPDGHRIAARKTAEGATTIIVLDADHPEAPAHGIPLGKTHVAGLKWAGNQR